MNFPEPLLQSLRGTPGFNEAAFLQAHEQVAPTAVRLHPLKGSGLFGDAQKIPWHPDGHYLAERPLFTADPLFHAGAYYVQEASSMLLRHFWKYLFEDEKNLRVLDLCAAPGGKSTLLAAELDAKSLLICNDAIRSRATILDENITRWGYTNTWVTSNDPRDFGRLHSYFDAVLIDAPCSGSGLFRKDQRALQEWSPEAVQLCAARQQRILTDSWPSLKENGVLLYATCSYSPKEDEAILSWLGSGHDVASIPVPMPAEWGVIEVTAGEKGLIGYRCFPDKVSGEGFFIAAVRKCEAAKPFYYPKFRTARPKKGEDAARDLLRPAAYAVMEDARRSANAIFAEHEPDFHLLNELVYLRRAGVRLGQAAQKDWIPEHDVALSIDRAPGVPQWHLSREEAIRFLRKEELVQPGLPKGWYVASYEGRGLGWAKILTARVNNYLPKGWRIRMELPDEDKGS